MSILDFLSEVGVPIFGAVVMAFFIFLSMKYIFNQTGNHWWWLWWI